MSASRKLMESKIENGTYLYDQEYLDIIEAQKNGLNENAKTDYKLKQNLQTKKPKQNG